MAAVASPLRSTALVPAVAASVRTSTSAQADSDVLVGSSSCVYPRSSTREKEAASKLNGQAREDAQLLGSIASANWFTSGTPAEVRRAVDKVVTAADKAGQLPVLVADDLPFRDCAQAGCTS